MNRIFLSLLVVAGISASPLRAQDADSTGMPGDNLDLYGVLDLFKASSSIEDFEKALNTETNNVNNLDLNDDGDVDYIRVVDHSDSGAHAITLQIPVNETESQDVAVIEIEKDGDESAIVQIVGDEDLYGTDYIVEPAGDDDKGTEKKFGQGFVPAAPIIVNVWGWPAVRFVYAPAYVIWVSPYRWGYYPRVWRPWHPVAWRVYHPRVARYHAHYHVVYVHRVNHAHRCYARHRVVSHTVHQRHPAPAHRNGGNQGGRQNGNHTQGKQGGGNGTHAKQGGNAGKGGGHAKQGGNAGKGNAGKGGAAKGGAKAGKGGGGGKRR